MSELTVAEIIDAFKKLPPEVQEVFLAELAREHTLAVKELLDGAFDKPSGHD